jgi:uncharacterized protein YndB with AHSA1/START domain
MSITKVPSSNDRLVIVAEISRLTPSEVFDYWTKPALLCRWWPQEAEINAHVGSNYHLSWPQMNWHLRGQYTCFEPAKQLAFTWKWDHDEEGTTVREVVITFEAIPGAGTKFSLTHGPYSNSAEDQEIRIGHHLAGWQHFIPRLQSLVETP